MSAGTCPACGEPNGCRMENGDSFKGRCWCEELVISQRALRRLEDRLADRCLCATCLQRLAADPEISWEELVRRSGAA